MDHLNDILSKLSHLDLSGQIEDIQPTATSLGASCDVFTGLWKAGKKKVAVKKLRVFLSKEEQVVKKLAREVYIWSKLEHKNVLPLLGFFLEGGEFPHMVSEWMEKGTLRDYMPHLGGDMGIVSMVMGIAAGLSYLHEQSVIHADLKSMNILISESGEPLLADFGVSHVLAASMTKMCGTTMASAKGTIRWMAIELLSLSDESGAGVTPNEKSDVWAFGMTIYEILKRNVPYSQFKGDHQVALAISKGKLPDRPSRTEKASLSLSERKLWEICGNCWKRKPEMRPTMRDILSAIVAIQVGKPRPVKRRKLDAPITSDATNMSDFPAHEVRSEAGGSLSRPTSVVAAAPSPDSPVHNSNTFLYDLNIGNFPPELKREGSDWFAAFNPKVKRRLDVNLLHTIHHESVACCVRFSPDGKYLATGCNRSAQVYDTQTGAKICALIDGLTDVRVDMYIRCLCFSPDGTCLATGAEDKFIRIWDIANECIIRIFEGHKQEIYSLSFSLDGRILVSGSGDKTVRIWVMGTGEQKVLEIIEPHWADSGVTSVTISPDGRLVAAGSLDSVVRIWDVESGNLIERLRGHRDSVYSIAFTPDGKGLVSGSLDKTLKHWDITPHTVRGATHAELLFENTTDGDKKDSGEQGSKCTLNFIGHQDYVLATSVSHDGRWVVSGSKDRGVRFWDRDSAEEQFILQGHKNSVISVDTSPRGDMFATGSGDFQARIWQCTAL